MGTRTRVLALALAGFALAVTAVAAWHGAAPADLYDLLVGAPARSEELDAHIDAARDSILAKEEVVRELVAGRLTLAEAADRFERLDARRYEALGLPRPSRGRAQAYCRVIEWASRRMSARALARLEQERARLEAPSPPQGALSRTGASSHPTAWRCAMFHWLVVGAIPRDRLQKALDEYGRDVAPFLCYDATERRAAPRSTPRDRLFQVLAPSGLLWAHGVVDDVSAVGVRLVAALPCPLGPAVLVPLVPHPLAGRQFPFRIERCVPLPGDCAFVAGPFDPPLTDAEARALAEMP
jgi:hypothetical protein